MSPPEAARHRRKGWRVKDIWYVYLFAGAFPALLVFAAVYKYIEVLQVRSWSSVPGRIVTSATESRAVKTGSVDTSDTELRNFARVEYAYTVAGRQYRGNRVSIGEDLGNFEIEQTLARYPVGRDVTVYYNPNRREQSVLERELPSTLWKGIAVVVLVLVALIVGAAVGFPKLAGWMRAVVGNPDRAPLVTALLAFAAFALLIVYAVHKQARATRRWPTVPGRIESAGVRAYEVRKTGNSRIRWKTRYRLDVVYSYEVAGVRYTGDRVGTGQVGSFSEAFADKAAARYAPGSAVAVHYNPENPAESIVQPGGNGLLALWLFPLALGALAYLVGR